MSWPANSSVMTSSRICSRGSGSPSSSRRLDQQREQVLAEAVARAAPVDLAEEQRVEPRGATRSTRAYGEPGPRATWPATLRAWNESAASNSSAASTLAARAGRGRARTARASRRAARRRASSRRGRSRRRGRARPRARSTSSSITPRGRRDPLAVERRQHHPAVRAVVGAVGRQQPVAEQRDQVARSRRRATRSSRRPRRARGGWPPARA